MRSHGETPGPWSEEDIDLLVGFVNAMELSADTGARVWGRDERRDDPYEGDRAASQGVFVVNLGDRCGYLDGMEELATVYTIVDSAAESGTTDATSLAGEQARRETWQ